MTIRDPEEVQRPFRRERWAVFVSDMRRSWVVWILICVVLLATTYYVASPIRLVETVRGVAVGAHLPPSEDNRKLMRLSVRLDSGATVGVRVPRGTLYRVGMEVEMEVLRREWPPHVVTHRFVRYVEAPAT